MCSNQWGVLEPENFEKEGTSWTDVVVEYLSSSVGTSGKPPRLAPAKGQPAHSLTDQSRLLEGLVAWDFQKGGNVLSKVPPMIARRWRAQAKASICLQVAVDHGYLGCNDLFNPPHPTTLTGSCVDENERHHSLSSKTLGHIRMALESFSRISKQLVIHANTTSRVRGWIEGGVRESIADFAFEKINKISHKLYLNIYFY